jgi:ketosteroid isomerase-like protein
MRTRSLSMLLLAACAIASLRAHAHGLSGPMGVQLQLPLSPPSEQAPANPLADPSVSPSNSFLYSLEAKFAKATAEGGGKGFSSFFADDAVTLANGEAPVIGRAAIAQHAVWSAKDYQLTWTPQGARMSPGGDMGFTWGHYEGHSKDKNGNPIVTAGRYFTVWKKQPDGEWKVELDASNNEPANSGDCCRLP